MVSSMSCVAQRTPWQAATCLQRWIAGEPDVKQERHSTDEKYLMEIIYDRKQLTLWAHISQRCSDRKQYVEICVYFSLLQPFWFQN